MQPPVCFGESRIEARETDIRRNGRAAPGKPIGRGHVKRDVMFFWGHHCHRKFDAPTICYALDRGREDVEPELGSLVEAGIVDRQLEDGVVFYSLPRNEERRRPIVERAGPGHPGN